MCLSVPGKVMDIHEDGLRTASVSFGGITKDVSLVLVPEAGIGDYVIVHVGFAISKLDEEAARRTLELMAQLERGGNESEGREAPRPI